MNSKFMERRLVQKKTKTQSTIKHYPDIKKNRQDFLEVQFSPRSHYRQHGFDPWVGEDPTCQKKKQRRRQICIL